MRIVGNGARGLGRGVGGFVVAQTLLTLGVLVVATLGVLATTYVVRERSTENRSRASVGCSMFDDIGSCNSVPGCDWDDTFSCSGKSKTACQALDQAGCNWSGEQSCSGKSETECNNASQCTPNRPGCSDSDCNAGKSGCYWASGSKVNCSMSDNNCTQSGCVRTNSTCTGSTYIIQAGYCSGRTGCDSFDDGECQFMNCVWHPPTVGNCSNISSPTTCNSKPNCKWQAATCTGQYATPNVCKGSYYSGCSGGTYGGTCTGTYTDITQGTCTGTPIAPTATPIPNTPTPTKTSGKKPNVTATPTAVPTPYCSATQQANCKYGCTPDVDGGKCKSNTNTYTCPISQPGFSCESSNFSCAGQGGKPTAYTCPQGQMCCDTRVPTPTPTAKPVCKPGTAVCVDEDNSRACSDQGQWLVVEWCSAGCVSSTGRCSDWLPPTPTLPMQAMCDAYTMAIYDPGDDGILQSGTDRVLRRCEYGCSAETNACLDEGGCTEGNNYCIDDTTMAVCNADRNGYDYIICPEGKVCQDDLCRTPKNEISRGKSGNTLMCDAYTMAIYDPGDDGVVQSGTDHVVRQCEYGCLDGEDSCYEGQPECVYVNGDAIIVVGQEVMEYCGADGCDMASASCYEGTPICDEVRGVVVRKTDNEKGSLEAACDWGCSNGSNGVGRCNLSPQEMYALSSSDRRASYVEGNIFSMFDIYEEDTCAGIRVGAECWTNPGLNNAVSGDYFSFANSLYSALNYNLNINEQRDFLRDNYPQLAKLDAEFIDLIPISSHYSEGDYPVIINGDGEILTDANRVVLWDLGFRGQDFIYMYGLMKSESGDRGVNAENPVTGDSGLYQINPYSYNNQGELALFRNNPEFGDSEIIFPQCTSSKYSYRECPYLEYDVVYDGSPADYLTVYQPVLNSLVGAELFSEAVQRSGINRTTEVLDLECARIYDWYRRHPSDIIDYPDFCSWVETVSIENEASPVTDGATDDVAITTPYTGF